MLSHVLSKNSHRRLPRIHIEKHCRSFYVELPYLFRGYEQDVVLAHYRIALPASSARVDHAQVASVARFLVKRAYASAVLLAAPFLFHSTSSRPCPGCCPGSP